MGIFDKMFGKAAGNDKKPGSQDVITAMLTLADVHMEQGDFEQAAATYKNIVGLQPNTTAQYNLGSLYAQGKGVEQSYLEGAYIGSIKPVWAAMGRRKSSAPNVCWTTRTRTSTRRHPGLLMRK